LRLLARFCLQAALGCALSCALPSWPVLHAQTPDATTPDAAIHKVCTACHDLQIVMDTPKDYNDWHDTVQVMIGRGANGSPDEFDLVMQFLYENMTKVDVNHADEDTLAATLHASPEAVAAIVTRRKTKPYKDLADLEASVPGLDRAALDAKKRMIFFQ
jgi:hypothetical protein